MLYPQWLNPGDNSWQMTAATLVGLMSVPGLVVLYGGVMQKRWSVNSMMLAFVAFAVVLLVWVLYAFKMGFGTPISIGGKDSFWHNFLGKPGPVLNHKELQGQGKIPNLGAAGVLDFPQSSLVYFQFVFAAITPILMLGSILGRVNFKAWIPFVILWITVHLHDQRLPDLGRRLVRPARRRGLQRRLRHPPRGRRLGLRRRVGDRPATRP